MSEALELSSFMEKVSQTKADEQTEQDQVLMELGLQDWVSNFSPYMMCRVEIRTAAVFQFPVLCYVIKSNVSKSMRK